MVGLFQIVDSVPVLDVKYKLENIVGFHTIA